LERFVGLSCSGAQKRVARPLAGSKKSMPVWEAMISPPLRRTEMAVTISGRVQLAWAPLPGFQRLILREGTSVQ
jgi:hypothetical protein